jgi:hypothetical protein
MKPGDMAQFDIEAHQKRVSRDVRSLLISLALWIAFAVCAGIGAGWLIWGIK